MNLKALAAFGFIVTTIATGWTISRSSNAVAATGPIKITAVFRADTLHDLARLLRPLNYSVPSGPTGNKTLHLRDAIYVGAASGRAQLLTVWLSENSSDDSLLLSNSDAGKAPSEIADRLAQEALAGKVFAVMPAEVGWQNWTLSVTRIGNSIVKGPAPVATQLSIAINNTSPALKQIDTRSVNIPIGFGLSKSTGWQPWFAADNVVIEMSPTPAGTPSSTRPDITPLGEKAGFLVGDRFLNNVFAVELREQFIGTTVDNASYHAQDLQFAAEPARLVISGQYVEQAPPATVRMQAEFAGVDLLPVRISNASVNCGTLAPLACAQVRASAIAAGVLLTNQINPDTQIRPTDEQNLGNFFIGSKPLSGIARIDRLEAVSGSIVVVCSVRLKGGHI